VVQYAVVGNGTIFQRGTCWREREVWEDDRERQSRELCRRGGYVAMHTLA